MMVEMEFVYQLTPVRKITITAATGHVLKKKRVLTGTMMVEMEPVLLPEAVSGTIIMAVMARAF